MDDDGENEEVKRIKRRGQNIEWHLVERFPTVDAFRASQIYPQLKMFTLKNSWKSGQTKVESWVCKYARKAQYKKCQRMLKLEYQLSRMEVFDNDNHCNHESDQLKLRRTNKKYLWTEQHEQIFPSLMLAGATAKAILRELWAHGLTDIFGNFPTLLQINTKKNYMFKKRDIDGRRIQNARPRTYHHV